MSLDRMERKFLDEKDSELHRRLNELHPIRKELMRQLDGLPRSDEYDGDRRAVKESLNEVRAEIRDCKKQLKAVREQRDSLNGNAKQRQGKKKNERAKRRGLAKKNWWRNKKNADQHLG